jgi:DNA polymerase III subunit epsilon
MPLELQKPLVFIDLETTGINIAYDRIVEIAIVKVMPNRETKKLRKLINPTIVIPEQSTAIHGITNEMVANAPTFAQVANEIKQFMADGDIGGYNSNRFDVPLLAEEFLRVDLDVNLENVALLDVQRIFHIMEPRTLSAAYKFYCGKELVNAHSAEADVMATWEILQAQMERYNNLGTTMETVHQVIGKEEIIDFARRFIYNDKGIAVFNFGKHKGKPVTQVLKEEPQYYDWMMKNDFELHTKKKMTEMYNKMKLGL